MAESTGKIRVHGKAMNRTALGIVNAYLKINPQTTAEDLAKAFPPSLTSKFAKLEAKKETDPFYKYGLFHEIVTVEGKRVWAHNHEDISATTSIFEQEDETIHTADGKELAMESVWTSESYNDMLNWAKQYGIEVASFEKFDGGFTKGSFSLENINGFVAPLLADVAKKTEDVAEKAEEIAKKAEEAVAEVTNTDDEQPEEEKKSKCKWWWWLLLLLLLLLLLFLLLRGCSKEDVKDNVESASTEAVEAVEAATAVKDSVVAEVSQAIEKIEKKFNAAKFIKGKANLTDETKAALKDMEQMLLDNPNLKLKVIGHSSPEGDAAFNQKLSEDRAKAAVDYLISKGVKAEQLEYEGKGSTELISDDPDQNRRTEFVLVE
ncbi:MAG: OmpA family protein [Bacteroidales bacterium]|nr:OmpA family protein [Bacteroidales bacterium]